MALQKSVSVWRLLCLCGGCCARLNDRGDLEPTAPASREHMGEGEGEAPAAGNLNTSTPGRRRLADVFVS